MVVVAVESDIQSMPGWQGCHKMGTDNVAVIAPACHKVDDEDSVVVIAAAV